MWDDIFASADMLQNGLQASWIRSGVIRHNIANVETPGFKASDVVFETLFSDALRRENTGFVGRRTRERHIEIGKQQRIDPRSVTAKVTKHEELSMRMDENSVDIEVENVKMAQNSIWYNTMMSKLNSEISRIRLAVTEGK
ncbi:MAG: flagellar basal body rod protein FlgB [Oscillospiraceae bacterium]|nr:flagellar basal body rod protein FlgB [Oscillospiraceae bacterium]